MYRTSHAKNLLLSQPRKTFALQFVQSDFSPFLYTICQLVDILLYGVSSTTIRRSVCLNAKFLRLSTSLRVSINREDLKHAAGWVPVNLIKCYAFKLSINVRSDQFWYTRDYLRRRQSTRMRRIRRCGSNKLGDRVTALSVSDSYTIV